MRPHRELAINPGNEAARERLQAIESENFTTDGNLMTTYVQENGSTAWHNYTTAGVAQSSLLVFVGIGDNGGSPSVDSFTLGGAASYDGLLQLKPLANSCQPKATRTFGADLKYDRLN